jgi:dihydroxyacetone kinase
VTHLYDDPTTFMEDMLVGFLDANRRYVAGVPGGVVRANETRCGKVAVVVGGGSGHYPAFCGVVGAGFADGAVVGNIFTSPSTDDAYHVAAAADGGGGVLFSGSSFLTGQVGVFGCFPSVLAGTGPAYASSLVDRVSETEGVPAFVFGEPVVAFRPRVRVPGL